MSFRQVFYCLGSLKGGAVKFTICGLQQDKLLKMGLDCQDAVIIAWFKDFRDTTLMCQKVIDYEIYNWVNYQTVLDELPILHSGKPPATEEQRRNRRIKVKRCFDKYVKCGLMKKHEVKGVDEYMKEGQQMRRRGSFTYFCFNSEVLVSLLSKPKDKEGVTKK